MHKIEIGQSYRDYNNTIIIKGADDRFFVTGNETDPMWYAQVYNDYENHEEMVCQSYILELYQRAQEKLAQLEILNIRNQLIKDISLTLECLTDDQFIAIGETIFLNNSSLNTLKSRKIEV